MVKQRKKKRKLKRFFRLLLIILVISFAYSKLSLIKIRSVTIKGNDILSDQEILEICNIDNYPSFLKTSIFKLKDKLLKNNYVKDAKVIKGLFTINITIKEEKVLYINGETNEKVTNTSKFVDKKSVCAPILIGYVPDKKIQGFKKALSKIDNDVMCKMSQIKHDPNEIDEDRYFVYMNDGNGVYLTVNKFKKLNKYDAILENVGKQNGVMYLDYGDFFEVK